ncbi:peptide chain release factor, partial [Neisseria meningitidis]|nr:peptide chain release factor [Neisseria meningitidis]
TGIPVRMNLGLTQERWPDIVFHETREHSVKL